MNPRKREEARLEAKYLRRCGDAIMATVLAATDTSDAGDPPNPFIIEANDDHAKWQLKEAIRAAEALGLIKRVSAQRGYEATREGRRRIG